MSAAEFSTQCPLSLFSPFTCLPIIFFFFCFFPLPHRNRAIRHGMFMIIKHPPPISYCLVALVLLTHLTCVICGLCSLWRLWCFDHLWDWCRLWWVSLLPPSPPCSTTATYSPRTSSWKDWFSMNCWIRRTISSISSSTSCGVSGRYFLNSYPSLQDSIQILEPSDYDFSFFSLFSCFIKKPQPHSSAYVTVDHSLGIFPHIQMYFFGWLMVISVFESCIRNWTWKLKCTYWNQNPLSHITICFICFQLHDNESKLIYLFSWPIN